MASYMDYKRHLVIYSSSISTEGIMDACLYYKTPPSFIIKAIIFQTRLSPSSCKFINFMRGKSMEGESLEDFGCVMTFHGHDFELVVRVAYATGALTRLRYV